MKPMPYFTPEELNPSEATLRLLKQLARTYRVAKTQHHHIAYSLN